MLDKTLIALATAYYKDPAKVAVAVAIAAVVAATVVALSFLPVGTQEVLYGTFSSTITALLAGLATRKRAWSPESVAKESERAFREGVSVGAGTVN